MTARRTKKRARRTKRGLTSRANRWSWSDLPDTDLLQVRMCDLRLRVEETPLFERVEKLHEELAEHDILLRPHVWFSTEWFSPDGIPGIAAPFYLGHERLIKLEKKMFMEAEGVGERECMRLLRHEAGHTMCTAYRLHYRKRWRELFGSYTEPYPDFYHPKPNSRRYVMHLGRWYAQAHPAEDFAETFAVWLRPNSRWKQQYKGWPALAKLEYVEELMGEIAGEKPAVRKREHIESINDLRVTLAQHYKHKREVYGTDFPDFYDRDLLQLFSHDPKHAHRESAAMFLRRARRRVRETVARWTGEYQYTIDQVLMDMIDRCKELKLRVHRPTRETEVETMLMVAVQTMNYLHGGRHRIAM
jgi:hypothetical protein